MPRKESESILKNLTKSLVVEAITKYVSRDFLRERIEACGVKEKRTRKLGAVLMIYVLLYGCLFRDSNRREVLKKLVEGYSIRGWRIPAKSIASACALSKAQKRLGVKVIKKTYEDLAKTEEGRCEDSFYKGMRLRAYDGSCFNLEDSEENRRVYGKPSSSGEVESAWPQLKLLMQVDVGTRKPIQVAFGGYRRSEQEMFEGLLKKPGAGELSLIDRGLAHAKYLRLIQERGGHFLAHMKKGRKIEVVEYLRDGSYLGLLKDAEKGGKLLVRVMEYRIDNPQRGDCKEVHRLVTDLMDEKVTPAIELIELYHERWEIEISFDELKTHFFKRPTTQPFFRSQRKEGVIQELYALLMVYRVIRSLMQEAADKYSLAPRQLSFINCVHILRRGVVRMQAARSEQLPKFYEDILDEMAATLLPERDNRINPRVIKRPYPKFSCKRPHHFNLPKLQTTFSQDIRMLHSCLS